MPKNSPINTEIKPGKLINNKGRRSATSLITYPSTEKPCDVGFLVEVFFKFLYLQVTSILSTSKPSS